MAKLSIPSSYPTEKKSFAPAVIGAVSELIVCSWLLKDGYEVFRNVCATGAIDIVAIKGDVIRKFDIKSTVIEKNGKPRSHIRAKTQKQIDRKIEIICVDNEGNCYFEEHFKDKPSYINRDKIRLSMVDNKIIESAHKICAFCQCEFKAYLNRKITLYCSHTCKRSMEFKRKREDNATRKAIRNEAKARLMVDNKKPEKISEFVNNVLTIT